MIALPLMGRRILVTRAREQAGTLCLLLEAAGAVPIVVPAIGFEPVADLAPLEEALARLVPGGWLVFTSANAVPVVLDRVIHRGVGLPPGVRIAAVGPATRRALESRGVRVDAMPADHLGAAVAAQLGDVRGKVVVLPASDIARDETAEALVLAGADVIRVSVYRTTAARPDAAAIAELSVGVDAVTFTSPSTVRGLVTGLPPALVQLLKPAVIACIGPTTAAVARGAGLAVAVMPREHTAEALVSALADYFARTGWPVASSRSFSKATV